jgi:hypothetical protein
VRGRTDICGQAVRATSTLALLLGILALIAPGAMAGTSAASTATAPASTLVPQSLGSGGLSGGLPVTPSSGQTTTSPPVAVPTSTTASSGGGLGGNGTIALAAVAVVVLGGVVWFIWRDSRRHATVKPGGYTAAEALGGGRSGSKAPPKSRQLSQAERKRRRRGRAR